MAASEGCANSQVDVVCSAGRLEGARSDLPAAITAVTAMPGGSPVAMDETSATSDSVLTKGRQLHRFEPKHLRTRISAFFRSTANSWPILLACPPGLQYADQRIFVSRTATFSGVDEGRIAMASNPVVLA